MTDLDSKMQLVKKGSILTPFQAECITCRIEDGYCNRKCIYRAVDSP